MGVSEAGGATAVVGGTVTGAAVVGAAVVGAAVVGARVAALPPEESEPDEPEPDEEERDAEADAEAAPAVVAAAVSCAVTEVREILLVVATTLSVTSPVVVSASEVKMGLLPGKTALQALAAQVLRV